MCCSMSSTNGTAPRWLSDAISRARSGTLRAGGDEGSCQAFGLRRPWTAWHDRRLNLIVEDREPGHGPPPKSPPPTTPPHPHIGSMSHRIVEQEIRRRSCKGCSTSSGANTPVLSFWTSTEQVHGPGRTRHDVFNTLQVLPRSYYVNHFNAFCRTWQVCPCRPRYRTMVSDIQPAPVRTSPGADGAFGHAARRVGDTAGPLMVLRATTCIRRPRSPSTLRLGPALPGRGVG